MEICFSMSRKVRRRIILYSSLFLFIILIFIVSIKVCLLKYNTVFAKTYYWFIEWIHHLICVLCIKNVWNWKKWRYEHVSVSRKMCLTLTGREARDRIWWVTYILNLLGSALYNYHKPAMCKKHAWNSYHDLTLYVELKVARWLYNRHLWMTPKRSLGFLSSLCCLTLTKMF